MALTLLYHPLSSYCHKVLIALYERGIAFEPRLVNLGDPAERAALEAIWPIGKFPVLRDSDTGRDLAESSIIIEYLDRQAIPADVLIPDEADTALEVRFWDRVLDLYVQAPMQEIVGDRLRGANADLGRTRATLATAYRMIDRQMTGRDWLAGDAFSLADCAAAPALFYASILQPFPDGHAALAAYFERLLVRPSVQRVLREARPYFPMFPFVERMPSRFLTGPAG